MDQKILKRLDQLDKSLEILVLELSEYSEDQLRKQPAPGEWSALQVVHHLITAENLSLKYVIKKLSFDPKLKPAGIQSKARVLYLWLAFNSPFKYKAPEAVKGDHLPKDATLEKIKTQWLSQRKELREYLKGLPKEVFDKEVYKHPFVGRLSLEGMLHFFQIHFDRHHRQIQRTLK